MALRYVHVPRCSFLVCVNADYDLKRRLFFENSVLYGFFERESGLEVPKGISGLNDLRIVKDFFGSSWRLRKELPGVMSIASFNVCRV